jgi:benzoyl-CoA reductase subunit A
VSFEDLMSVFDKAIIVVENERMDLSFEGNIKAALSAALGGEPDDVRAPYTDVVSKVAATPLEALKSIGTGYGRQRLPFPKESIRSEILCHGLGAHLNFPSTATVLDIGGQDTKAIQVDGTASSRASR